jgi:hypothetical protein
LLEMFHQICGPLIFMYTLVSDLVLMYILCALFSQI